MKWNKKTTKNIVIESYVTLREEWPKYLGWAVDGRYMARGHRVVDGHMEWRYFEDEVGAKEWADAIHT